MSVDTQISKIAIVGSGAVGSFYGAVIQASNPNIEVHFLMRSDLEAVKANGLKVISDERDDFHLSQIRCAATTEAIGPVDLVLIALKTTDNQSLIDYLPPLLHDSTAIMTLQNGLGNEDFLADHFGADRILGGLCFVCINRRGPGVVHHMAHGLIEMGEFAVQRQNERTERIAELFKSAEIPCVIRENLMQARWRKLIWNIPFNGLAISEGGIDVQKLLSDSSGASRPRGGSKRKR
ncbi:MAG: 2-dehydropantoate 2-reductase [Verrucomicrobiota bacterium]